MRVMCRVASCCRQSLPDSLQRKKSRVAPCHASSKPVLV